MPFPLRERCLGWLQHSRPKALEASRSWLSNVGTARLHSLRARGTLGLFVVIAALAISPFVTPPIPLLPEPRDIVAILGALLTAQAAIAALALAITLFMMQGIRARRDVDDRMYREYVRRSWMRDTLWGSLFAVAVTGGFLLSEGFIGESRASGDVKPELRNLFLSAGLAFLLNLVLTGVLFERALRLSRPEQLMALRRAVNRTDVREAIQAFVRRTRRALDAREHDEPDLTILFPDQGEGSADEAIRALLEDASRAMPERRHEEFRISLESIGELIRHAMEEIRKTGIQWSPPGSQPEWPPLRELSRNLYSFREHVIRQGDRDYIFELLRFDYMLTREGMRERCGELFTVGLNGYRWNYHIANRIGVGELRELLRDRFSLNLEYFTLGAEPVEAFPYAREVIRHQERLLSEALHNDQTNDYDQLHRRFQGWLKAMRYQWNVDSWPSPQASELYQQLEKEYRIALMGLAGRAILLARSNRVADANPFLNATRLAYSHLGQMADDLTQVLSYDDSPRLSLWQEWELEDALPLETFTISTERYPLWFFTLRLMELSSEPMPTLDLHSRAQRVLDWFNSNSEAVRPYVRTELDPAPEQRHEFAAETLNSAVHRDEVTADYEVIERNLSEVRISTFKSEVYAAAFSGNSVERLFMRAGASLNIPAGAAEAPEERVIGPRAVGKGFLTDTAEGALIDYAPLTGGDWGRALSDDVLQRFCEALEGAPDIVAPLETPAALLASIDQAIENLGAPEHVVVVLAGDWFDLQVGLGTVYLEGYEPHWRLPESDRMGEIGRYRGHSILSARGYNGRCVFVVDLVGWGHFVRAKTDVDEDLRVEIKLISIGRARELLATNPDHFASQPDEESKLRKLQTYVEIVIGARTGFRVADTNRARRVTPIHQPEADNVTE